MADWVMPAALAQPLPRKVSMNGCLGGLVILFAIMASMIVFLILVIAAAHNASIGACPLALIACAIVGGPALTIGGLYGFYSRREKHVLQWGKAAPATIVGEYEVETRSGRAPR